MAIDFPNSPSTGQDFSVGTTTWTYDGAKWNLKTASTLSNDAMPIGSIMWYAGTAAPTGWVACNGASYPISTYPNLYQVIGNAFGGTSPNFNVPTISATTGAYYIRHTTAVGTQTSYSLLTAPVGSMVDWPVTSSYPTGWLRADGSSQSTNTYSDLFALIGYTYGGSGTSFNLPNMVSAGAGSPVTIIKATSSGFVEPSTVSHSATHTEGGSDAVTVTLNQIPNYRSNRNVLVNGAFNVWQRGNGPISVSGATYTADRWSSAATGGLQPHSVTKGTTTPPAGFQSYARLTPNTSSSTNFFFCQSIETSSVVPLQGKPVTLSFWYRIPVSFTQAWGVSILYSTATDGNLQYGATSTTLTSSNLSNTTAWTYVTLTGVLPSTATSLAVRFATTSNIISAAQFDITGVQLEAGSVATPFEFEPYETTLRKCQRHYYRINAIQYAPVASGISISSTAAGVIMSFPISMRTSPTLSGYGNLIITDRTAYDLAVTNITSVTTTLTSAFFTATNNTGAVVARVALLVGDGTNNGYFALTSEL